MGGQVMDRYTRNYLLVLCIIGGLVVAWWAGSIDFRAASINDRLGDDPLVASYPYRFRVLTVRNGVATLSSPRSFDFPVVRFLALVDPALAGKAPTDPSLVAAQARLAEVQKRVAALVRAEQDVDRVVWRLDRDWLRGQGIEPR